MIAVCPMPLSSELRKKLKATGLSANEIARQAGVAQSVVTRFLNGKDILSTTIDRLVEWLGLRLSPDEEGEPKKPKRR